MSPDRRRVLASLGSLALLAPSFGLLAGCETVGEQLLGQRSVDGRAALLLPQSGRYATIGRNMARASRLAAPDGDDVLALDVHDTGETSADAGAAAAALLPANDDIILGPLFANNLPAVQAAAGRAVPVISFSNDDDLRGSGAFIMGVTPGQSVSAILRYAQGQGVRRVAVLSESADLGHRAADAANGIAAIAGLEITGPVVMAASDAERSTLLGALAPDTDAGLPDAILLPEGGPGLAKFATLLHGTGIQLLGTAQWSGRRLAPTPELRGAWFAAPDPHAFASFADVFQSAYGEPPGTLAGLAYDATVMARLLASAGQLDRAGLLRPAGFRGVVGNFRFSPDGRCNRDMAIFAVDDTDTRVVGTMPAA